VISEVTVSRYMPMRPPRAGSRQRWATFMRNHLHETLAIDFAVVPTLTFEIHPTRRGQLNRGSCHGKQGRSSRFPVWVGCTIGIRESSGGLPRRGFEKRRWTGLAKLLIRKTTVVAVQSEGLHDVLVD
jgi:hypothetical protein